MLIRFLISMICLMLLSGAASAGTATFSGYFNNSGNAALVWSDLGAAQFGNDNDIANNIALYPLSVPIAGPVSFVSQGFAAGGADPYFTLFQGSGDLATFLGSNYNQAFFGGGGDFTQIYDLFNAPITSLAAGDYMIAMAVFANMSFAENSGGTLGDGFIFLGDPNWLGNYYYELVVTTPDAPIPEPATMLLVGSGLIGLAGLRKKSRK